MKTNNSIKYQWLGSFLVVPVLACGLLAGCADELQAEEDINSPAAGMVHLGDQMHAEGDDQGAMEFYARAVQRDPRDKAAHEKLAALLATHGDKKDAAEQYRILTVLQPDNVEYRRDYGRALILNGQTADAKAQYEKAIAIDAGDTHAQNGLGIADDLLGDHAAAQEHYKTALQEKPDDAVTLNNLGHSYILSGSYDAAISLLEPQYENPATPPEMRANLAEAYGMAGMYIDAERVMKKDLTPEQIKTKLAHYRSLRAKTSIPSFYASLGDFATADLANAHIDKIKRQYTAEIAGLNLEVVPEVQSQGGTPIFAVRANGFKNQAAAKSFCDKMKKDGASCKEHEG